MTMDYVRLGSAGLRVSPLCLGTMNLGPRTDRESSLAILDAAWDAGINFLDTANTYGRRSGVLGEELLGEWLALSPGRRDELVLATKVAGRIGDGPNDEGLSAKHIRRACVDSLRRLRTDYIDLYQMHHIDRAVSWEEIWQAMSQLQREGKVVHIGSSNFAGWQIAQASEAARRWNLMGPVSEQSVYNLATRTIELEVIPACRGYGMALLAYSPLGGGVLSAPAEPDPPAGTRRDSMHSRAALARLQGVLPSYREICREWSIEPAVLGLAWVAARAGVTATVVGPRTLSHLHGALAALEVRLDGELLTHLDQLFPGPGEAPEAYAW